MCDKITNIVALVRLNFIYFPSPIIMIKRILVWNNWLNIKIINWLLIDYYYEFVMDIPNNAFEYYCNESISSAVGNRWFADYHYNDAVETWTLAQNAIKKIEAFEMWRCWILKISWIDKVTNIEILHRMNKS